MSDDAQTWAPLEPEDRVFDIYGTQYVVTGGKLGYRGASVRMNGAGWEKQLGASVALDDDTVRAYSRQRRFTLGKYLLKT